MKIKKKLFSPNGRELCSIEEIKEYMITKEYTLSEMRKSSFFAYQFESGDLSHYNKIVEKLQVKDEEGNYVDDEEIYLLIKSLEDSNIKEKTTNNNLQK